MDWQQAAALVVVFVTAALLVRARWRRRRKVFGGSGPCGCPGGTEAGTTITFRGRRGEKPQIIVGRK